MTPQQDWEMLDLMTEKEAKMRLRLFIASMRCATDTVKDPAQDDSFSSMGHGICYGYIKGQLLIWESDFKSKQAIQEEEQRKSKQ